MEFLLNYIVKLSGVTCEGLCKKTIFFPSSLVWIGFMIMETGTGNIRGKFTVLAVVGIRPQFL
jgi:hypothetical protein